ncbi:MAG TPA: MFS transporter [Candidatus Paceibacterota bacterium]|nr:MFS transporter [Candidatus Paceibacterota bacterium]
MEEPVSNSDKTSRILTLPKNIFFLGLTSLFNDFSSEMVFSVFPAFFTSVLKAGAASLGMVDGIAEGLSDFFKIYSGSLSDKWQSRKPFVIAGYVLSTLTRPFYILFQTVGGALGLRVLDRVGKGFRDSPRDAIISLSSPKEELGRSFGYHRAMDTMGSILGPLVAYFILRSFPMHFNAVFLTAFFIGLITIVTLFFISDVALSHETEKKRVASAFKNLSWRFKLFILSIFILSVGSLPIAVMLLKTESIGLIIADIPLFYMIYNLSYAGFSMAAGKMSDKIGARAIIVIGYAILIASYFFLNSAHSPWILAGSFLLLGLFPALTDGVQRSLASQLSTAELRGGALGLLNAGVGFGALIAGIGGGYLWQAYSPTVAFLASGATIVVGMALFLLSTIQQGTYGDITKDFSIK